MKYFPIYSVNPDVLTIMTNPEVEQEVVSVDGKVKLNSLIFVDSSPYL